MTAYAGAFQVIPWPPVFSHRASRISTRSRVLVVDDNPLNLRLVEALLSAEHTLAFAATGQQALAEAARFKPHLMLVDLELPDMDGLSLVQQLMSEPALRSVRIVALTAHVAADVENAVRAAGCHGFLGKPVDPETFRESVRRYLSGDRTD